ncbi:M23 family metallopeptidase [Nonomuraea jiangxiensis]|uniref:Peptidase family M23 n=1 Tax=Nonomuraea jiangxiensis TaxID=633440 RepID=A0A1G8QEH6_9ACTN|nr:M23 family metallopeptidase [Nonomuraea jiangxiensis]SDJ02835.1 Peptidase family M23 [Nonomuraea jiangxiensis]
MTTCPSRSRVRRTATVAALGLAVLVTAVPLPAYAAVPEFQLPFPCGQKWRLDTWAHSPALDMVKEPDQAGTDGAVLVAPAAGTVNQSFYHSNAGNLIQIDHGGGHFTTYIHLKSRTLNVGARVQQGQEIGRVGATGPTSNGHPHLHYEQGYDRNGDRRATWGADGTERVRPSFNGVEYGQSDGRTWRNVTSANGCPTSAVEGRLYREPNGTIAVIAGGAPVRFANMDELNATGYGSVPTTPVIAGWLNTLPQQPRIGTYLHNPADNTIHVIAGGAKYALTYDEWNTLGRPAHVSVPVRFLNTYGAAPKDGTFLRDPANGGSIYLTVGGAKYHLTPADYAALGSPAFANVPIGWINTFGAVPRNGTYLHDLRNDTIFVINDGRKRPLTYQEWNDLGRPAHTSVPGGFLDAIPNVQT